MQNYETHTYRNPSSFSGCIYEYDFNSKTTIQEIANRIASDAKFDEFCKRTKLNKDKMKGKE